MKSIWLIRHAESEANFGLVTSDNAKVILTPHGSTQANYIAQAFDTAPALIVTSAYVRTQLTASPTIQRFPAAVCEEWSVQEFTYLAPDRCINTTTQQRIPMAQEYWQRGDPYYTDGEGAESFATLIGRVRAMMERFHNRKEPFIAVFTHGQFLRAMLWLILSATVEITPNTMQKFRQFDHSITMPNGMIIKMLLSDKGEIYFSNFITSHLPVDILS